MYAIVRAGGKQYRVEAGQMLDVDRMQVEPGSTIELGEILAISGDDGALTVGRPTVAGARVTAQVVGHHKGHKIIVLKFKPKVRYRRKYGHRQQYTRLRIKEIIT